MASLLILGGAACVWDDIDAAQRLGEFDAVCAVNDIGVQWPHHLDLWVTLHHEKLFQWQSLRATLGRNTDYISVCHSHDGLKPWSPTLPRIDKILDYRYEGMTSSGSSGLFAVKVGQEYGFNRIVLAGVPLEQREAHFFDNRPWTEVGKFRDAWKIAHPFIKDNVRSMSGWTRERLGLPTTEWLSEPATAVLKNG